MNAGRIEQIGVPDAIYSRPETRFVADFMGARNVLETTVRQITSSEAVLAWQGTTLRAPLLAQHWIGIDKTVAAAVRPESIRIAPTAANENAMSGRVVSRVDQGAFITIKIEVATDTMLIARQTKAAARESACAVGSTVRMSWDASDVVILRDAPRSTARPPVAAS
jgi:ABC-type Fe3+/spermidine/putrescine transport system ATPase subunit